MRGPFRIVAGAAGAMICAAAGAAWCALTPAVYEATASATFETGMDATAPVDLLAIRSLVAAEPVLRRAALEPRAAAAIQRESRPGALVRFATLLGLQAMNEDTLSRAAEMLAPRIDVRAGATPGMADIVVRMSSPADAAQVATAVADALVADVNATAGQSERRAAQDARVRLERAERLRAAARERLEAVSRIDFTPTATLPPPAPPEPAADKLGPLARAAALAEARRLEAARVFGPKHPQMIQIETEARRAAAALATAQASVVSIARSPQPTATRADAEGGPDPRATELAEAELAVAHAEAAYEVEAAHSRPRRTTARLLRAASVPQAPQSQPTAAIVAASALLGFLFAGAAPALRPRPPSARRDVRAIRPVAELRGGALDAAGARRTIELLRIADSRGARRVLVLGDDRKLVRIATCAIALAAVESGWRPLLVASGAPRDAGGAGDIVAVNGELFRVDTADTPPGAPTTARRWRGGHSRPIDADLAFDVAIVEDGAGAANPHAVVWIGATGRFGEAPEQCRRRGVDPHRLVGAIACASTARA